MRRAVIVFGSLLALAIPAIAGDTFDGFAVDCSSSAWTTIKAARSLPRRVRVQVLDSNAGGVCVSTVTASGTACDDTTPGIELSTGTAKNVSFEFLTRSQLNCRGRAGIATQKLKGFEIYNAQ